METELTSMTFTNNGLIHIIFVPEGQYVKDNSIVLKKLKKEKLIFSSIAFQIYQTTRASVLLDLRDKKGNSTGITVLFIE